MRDIELRAAYFHILLWRLKDKCSEIVDIRGKGFMIGILFTKKVKNILNLCLENNLLALPTNNQYVIRLMPSLILSPKEMLTIADILYNSIVLDRTI